jgi:hypothetical protein
MGVLQGHIGSLLLIRKFAAQQHAGLLPYPYKTYRYLQRADYLRVLLCLHAAQPHQPVAHDCSRHV